MKVRRNFFRRQLRRRIFIEILQHVRNVAFRPFKVDSLCLGREPRQPAEKPRQQKGAFGFRHSVLKQCGQFFGKRPRRGRRQRVKAIHSFLKERAGEDPLSEGAFELFIKINNIALKPFRFGAGGHGVDGKRCGQYHGGGIKPYPAGAKHNFLRAGIFAEIQFKMRVVIVMVGRVLRGGFAVGGKHLPRRDPVTEKIFHPIPPFPFKYNITLQKMQAKRRKQW